MKQINLNEVIAQMMCKNASCLSKMECGPAEERGKKGGKRVDTHTSVEHTLHFIRF